MKHITYITDCQDDNAHMRLNNKITTLMPDSIVQFVGASNEYEAALHLVDCLDTLEGATATIFVNVAPRSGTAKHKWPNGTPFGRVVIGNANIYTTIDGHILSLLQKLINKKISVEVYDIPATVPHFDMNGANREKLINTQFRSMNYLPRLCYELENGQNLPFENYAEVPEIGGHICYADSFGNLKTSLIATDIDFTVGEKISLIHNKKTLHLHCYAGLRDVPENDLALIIGSSGIEEKRLLEIVVQGVHSGGAELIISAKVGDKIEIQK